MDERKCANLEQPGRPAMRGDPSKGGRSIDQALLRHSCDRYASDNARSCAIWRSNHYESHFIILLNVVKGCDCIPQDNFSHIPQWDPVMHGFVHSESKTNRSRHGMWRDRPVYKGEGCGRRMMFLPIALTGPRAMARSWHDYVALATDGDEIRTVAKRREITSPPPR